MARRRTLARLAITGTALMSACTVATAVNTELSNERIHATLRAGTVLAAFTTLALLGAVFIKTQVDRVSDDLADAVMQAADELHAVVAETGTAMRMDRDTVDIARQVLAARLANTEPDHNQAA